MAYNILVALLGLAPLLAGPVLLFWGICRAIVLADYMDELERRRSR